MVAPAAEGGAAALPAPPSPLKRQGTSVVKRKLAKKPTANELGLDATTEAVLLRAPPKIPTYRQGDRCVVNGTHHGVVQFVGMIGPLGPGLWVGVQLDEPVGNSNGKVGGRTLFGCPPRHGGFYRASDLLIGLLLISFHTKRSLQNGLPRESCRHRCGRTAGF